MKKEVEKVSVVKCNSYSQKEVDKAVKESIDLIGFEFKKNSRVMIKPNIVTANVKNKKATYTQPQIIDAICKILKKNKCKIFIGESSFMDTDEFFKKSGIEKVAKKYGAKVVIFEQDKLSKIKNPKNKVLKEFPVSKTFKEMDLIINVPKLKTHILTKYTGAIKNLYGVIPGGLKQKLHNDAKGEKKFSNLLVDIYQNIKPELNIMEGVVGMQGHGPTSGSPVNSKIILASKDAVALDIAGSGIIGCSPKKIFAINFAIKRGLYPDYKFELVGLKKLPKIHFKKPPCKLHQSRLRRAFAQKPIICNEKKCIQCGTCAKKCPVDAITLKPYPVIDKKKCIRCFCCMEICPVDALHLKK